MATAARQQETGKLVFRKLHKGSLSNLIHIAVIKSNLAKLLLFFDNRKQ